MNRPVAWWMRDVVHPEDMERKVAFFTRTMQVGTHGTEPLRNRLRTLEGKFISARWVAVTRAADASGPSVGRALGIVDGIE